MDDWDQYEDLPEHWDEILPANCPTPEEALIEKEEREELILRPRHPSDQGQFPEPGPESGSANQDQDQAGSPPA